MIFLAIFIPPLLLVSNTICLSMSADYETGTLDSGYPDIETLPPVPGRAQVETNLTRGGRFAAFHQLYAGDPSVAGSKRCESDAMKMTNARIKAGVEVFYGVTFYIPSTWSFDGDYDDILVQWKGFGGGPFMFITQKHEGLFLRINGNPDPDYDPGTGEESMTKSQYVITQGMERGRWHDFRLRVIWDWELLGAGLVAVDYKTSKDDDYARVVSVLGPNMYNREGYLKWGIYKPAWQQGLDYNVTMRKVWHDNVRIGLSWEDVDPACDN